MIFLYDSWYSIVFLRPKNRVKLPRQSTEKWICMGKWPFPSWGIYFLKNEKVPDDRSFFSSTYATKILGRKKSVRKPHDGAKKVNKYYLKKIIFCENDYNLAVNAHFWAWSNFNGFANFGSLITNDGSLELSHQGKFVFCHLAGDRNKYKQTVGQRETTTR